MSDIIHEINQKLNSIKIDKDTNLLPENLKKGITFLGINGNLQSKTEIKLENVDPLETPYGVEYPFTLKDGKYVNSNSSVKSSFSYGKLYFVSDGVSPLSFTVENSGYSEYNCGVFSNIDCDLYLDYNYQHKEKTDIRFYSFSKTGLETKILTYPIVSKGLHYITFKFIKSYYDSPAKSEDYLKINSESFLPINTIINVFGVKTIEELDSLNPNSQDYCVIKNNNALYLYFKNSWKEIFSNTLEPINITAEDIYGEDIVWFNNGNKEVKTGGSLQNVNNLTQEEILKRLKVYNTLSELTPSKKLPLHYTFEKLKYKIIPTINVINYTSSELMFYQCKNLEEITIKNSENITDMHQMFQGCLSLKNLTIGDTSNVTNMSNMFDLCKVLTVIPELDTSKVTNMSSMFSHCESLISIPKLNTSNVTNMSYMFTSCFNLTTIPELDTSNVTNMRYMFNVCGNLTSIPKLDTSKVTTMERMFSNCTNLTIIPELNTSKVTNMSNMFWGCNNLSDESLNNILAMAAKSKCTTKTMESLFGYSYGSALGEKLKTLSNYQAFIDAGWTLT